MKRKIENCGFSLIELLVVMGIIGLIVAMVVPSMSVAGSSRLKVASQTVMNELDLARQLAASRNLVHLVKVYKFRDSGDSREVFQAIQIFSVEPDGSINAAGRLKRLGQGIAFNESADLSSLLNQTNRPAQTGTNQPDKLPGNIPYQFVWWTFRPDGSTDLSASNRWFITLHESKADVTSATSPANRITVEIEPVLGSLRLFQP